MGGLLHEALAIQAHRERRHTIGRQETARSVLRIGKQLDRATSPGRSECAEPALRR